jgi:hypothetical protein
VAFFASGQKTTSAALNAIFAEMFSGFMTQGVVATSGTTVATTYSNALTGGGTGPSVSLTSTGSLALVLFSALVNINTAGLTPTCSIAVTGATTITAATMESNQVFLRNTNVNPIKDTDWGLVAITPGLNTYEMQYRVGGATQTGTFSARRLMVWAP